LIPHPEAITLKSMMRPILCRSTSLSKLVSLAAPLLAGALSLAAQDRAPATNHPLRIVLVGDSTVTTNDPVMPINRQEAFSAAPAHPPLRAGDSKRYPHTGEPPLPSGLKPLFDVRMRDPSICLGPDGIYYLTGTTGTNIWVANDGIEIWKSRDLKNWTPLGMVWRIERDGSWQKQWTMKNGNRRRALWAPEIHWLKGNFFIAYCITGLGTGLLRSTTGKPEGPYVSVNQPDAPLTPGIDASLFEDDDGKVYFVYGSGFLARMKDDLSGLAEEPVRLRCDPGDPDIEHHHPQRPCPPSEYDHVGFEGAFLFKANGRYYLSGAERYYERYHCMTAESETLRGPYHARYVSVPEAGHNVFFQDAHGRWWSTIFGNDDDAPFHERPGILRIEFDQNGHIRPLAKQPSHTP
jgi:beta-xylosidase